MEKYSQRGKFGVEEFAGDISVLDELLFLDDVEGDIQLVSANGVAHPGVEVTEWLRSAMVKTMVETSRLHLLSEGNNIRRGGEVPVLSR